MAWPFNPRGCTKVRHTLILLRPAMKDGLGLWGCRVSWCAATLLPHEPSLPPGHRLQSAVSLHSKTSRERALLLILVWC